MNFAYPVLVSDVGGTNARFAVIPAPGVGLIHLRPQLTDAHAGLASAAQAALAGSGLRPASMIACVAGPVSRRSAHLTNADWAIEGTSLADALGLEQGLLLNDFEAQALSLPALRDSDCTAIGGGMAADGGPLLILGPGTGLGVAGLIRTGTRYLPLPAEAGHIELGPVGPQEEAIWPRLERFHGRITAEALISGPGLVRLHAARMAVAGDAPSAHPDGVSITSQALADPRSPEAETIRHFWRLVARFAGDMALVFLSRGGVTLAGGILPRIMRLLDPAAFRAAFEDKAPMEAIVRAMPVRVITAADTVLLGMAAIAAAPHAYAIDYGQRSWR